MFSSLASAAIEGLHMYLFTALICLLVCIYICLFLFDRGYNRKGYQCDGE